MHLSTGLETQGGANAYFTRKGTPQKHTYVSVRLFFQSILDVEYASSAFGACVASIYSFFSLRLMEHEGGALMMTRSEHARDDMADQQSAFFPRCDLGFKQLYAGIVPSIASLPTPCVLERGSAAI